MRITDTHGRFSKPSAVRTWPTYSRLYCKSDVLLLADIFESFIDVCLEKYKLDFSHYITAPALSWDAMLKMTDVKLRLLTDSDMHLFFEEGIRGGVSMITDRYAKANHKYMKDFNPKEETLFHPVPGRQQPLRVGDEPTPPGWKLHVVVAGRDQNNDEIPLAGSGRALWRSTSNTHASSTTSTTTTR